MNSDHFIDMQLNAKFDEEKLGEYIFDLIEDMAEEEIENKQSTFFIGNQDNIWNAFGQFEDADYADLAKVFDYKGVEAIGLHIFEKVRKYCFNEAAKYIEDKELWKKRYED